MNEVQLHHFSYASQIGCGPCSYVRIIDDSYQVHCLLAMAKARAASVRLVTIPRLKLTAAVLSVCIAKSLDDSSTTTLLKCSGLIVMNDSRRFHIYVANRVAHIREPSQWRHVDPAVNPADMASRGISASQLSKRSYWFTGQEFLWKADLSRDSPSVTVNDHDT